MDEDAAVEQFSPVFFFGGVGDGCAKGFPDEWPRDGDVGEAVMRIQYIVSCTGIAVYLVQTHHHARRSHEGSTLSQNHD